MVSSPLANGPEHKDAGTVPKYHFYSIIKYNKGFNHIHYKYINCQLNVITLSFAQKATSIKQSILFIYLFLSLVASNGLY